jgi:hypothetical protein
LASDGSSIASTVNVDAYQQAQFRDFGEHHGAAIERLALVLRCCVLVTGLSSHYLNAQRFGRLFRLQVMACRPTLTLASAAPSSITSSFLPFADVQNQVLAAG